MLILIDLKELPSYKQNIFQNRIVSIRLLIAMLIFRQIINNNIIATFIKASS
jgi:hypothetical protein